MTRRRRASGFAVYINYRHKRAVVHSVRCPYYKLHGGVSKRNPPTGAWTEDLPTVVDADRRAQREAQAINGQVKECGSPRCVVARRAYRK